MTRYPTVRSIPLKRLRWVGYAEGLSFVLLIAIAMPLKYIFEMPIFVRVIGMAHGVLFLTYLALIALAVRASSWPIKQAPTLVMASLLPFGPFLVDGRIREAEKALDGAEREAS